MTDTRKLVELITILHSHFHKPLTQSETDKSVALSYKMGLEDLDIGQVERGILGVIRSHKYASVPTVAQIRELAGAPTLESKATRAWQSVLFAMRRVGRYNSVQFADTTIVATIEAMGGWERICMTETANLPFVRKEFEATYAELAKAGVQPSAEYLSGIHGGFPVLVEDGTIKLLGGDSEDSRNRRKLLREADGSE